MVLALTSPDNRQIFVNSEHVIRFHQVDEHSSIRLSDGTWLDVREDAQYIATYINNNK